MEKIILNDQTEIEIKEGASTGNIAVAMADWDGVKSLIERLTVENLKKVQFASDDIVSGEYTDMVLVQPIRITTAPEMEVAFGIRERTQDELQQADVQTAIAYLSDEQALTVKELYPEWSGKAVSYAEGDRVIYGDILYKCISAHTSQADWTPGAAPSLWTALEDGQHAGTQDDPIPVPETVTAAGMEYEKGKYYTENDKTYLMNREGMDDGEKVILYFPPSQLVGQYFEVVE